RRDGHPRIELWDALSGQCRVRVALPVEAVVERDIGLVAFTLLDRRCPLARPSLARVVTRATNGVELRVLRYPAVDQARRPRRGVLEDGRPLLLGREESGRARRRPVEVQLKVQAKTPVWAPEVPVHQL